MKGEDYIKEKVGKENPFKVPANYFENVTPAIMQNLPEKERLGCSAESVSKWDRIKPLVYMAAMFIGAALIIQVGLFLSPEESVKTDEMSHAVSPIEQDGVEYEEEYIDYIIEASMLDDYDLYVYLSEAE